MITENLKSIKATIPDGVQLVAVSKTKPVELIQEAYDFGQRVFGENKVQEMVAKYEQMPKDIEWHMIGHLQSNKVKYMASFVSLVHAVDSYELLEKINKEAQKHNRVIRCLLQFHIATEETKFGLSEPEAVEMLSDARIKDMQNVHIVGVMGMASNTENLGQVHAEFHHLKQIFDDLKSRFFAADEQFRELSMGMSGDYRIAIEEGSTMVRIGSSIFGERDYSKV